MNLQSVNNYKSPNFEAYKIARVTASLKNQRTSDIDIFALTRSDKTFLDKLEKQVNYKKLFPKLCESLQKRWQKVFQYCVACAHDPDNRTYVAMHNNKPCGIMVYVPSNSLYLEGLCSIPQEPNKKIPFVGDTLLYQLFTDAKISESAEIRLKAVTDGPFDVVKKYEARGFKKDPTTVPYSEMCCNKYKIKEQLNDNFSHLKYESLDPETAFLDDTVD